MREMMTSHVGFFIHYGTVIRSADYWYFREAKQSIKKLRAALSPQSEVQTHSSPSSALYFVTNRPAKSPRPILPTFPCMDSGVRLVSEAADYSPAWSVFL
jgi:hypothetical protein